MSTNEPSPLQLRLRLLLWSAALPGLALVGLVLAVFFVLSLSLLAIWFGLPLLILATVIIRGLTEAHRGWLAEWLGTPIPTPYRPLPPTRNILTRSAAILRDPATWRDLSWLFINATLGLLLTLLPLALLAQAVQAVLINLYWPALPGVHWVMFVPVQDAATALLALLPGLLCLLLFWWLSPVCMRAYARLSRLLLAPTENQRLAARVQHLHESRADTVDAQASEVRRIERDLHDGAQARLVSLGMSLGLAEEIFDHDPATAQRLLAEARATTQQALTELRSLVRGIHPPVLVERGLQGAIRALVVSQAIPVTVDIDLPGRPPAPVESAAYFAITEVLTNITKHAAAERAWVRVNHGRGRLVIVVGDDGVGGADRSGGSGLRGIERRLDAFDGTIGIVSPAGGPTIVTMELPCVLSSPRTSLSSGTG
ncbi:sensor domain-containing protein [Lipingzhangella sp. LS1_29]|uniref:histidine kinase n=1 Tax=Lipingzhangella rawalii TaxID=2055835 RepID=A0ABU2H1W7_9ACTN|nr:sensor domain-containing protein [Lipingzhangella rawalii]MDS1269293.1 sensor domain-containing protein [Lipingzhangella rawalii]